MGVLTKNPRSSKSANSYTPKGPTNSQNTRNPRIHGIQGHFHQKIGQIWSEVCKWNLYFERFARGDSNIPRFALGHNEEYLLKISGQMEIKSKFLIKISYLAKHRGSFGLVLRIIWLTQKKFIWKKPLIQLIMWNFIWLTCKMHDLTSSSQRIARLTSLEPTFSLLL